MENNNLIEIQGRHCKDVKIFTSNVEEEALSSIYAMADSRMFRGSKIRIMPDVHQGKGCVIGTTYPIGEFVSPNHVGVDIGCTVSCIFFDKPLEEKKYAQFERKISKAIPTGFSIHPKRQFEMKDFLKFMNNNFERIYQTAGDRINYIHWDNETDIENWCKTFGMDYGTFLKSLGTLGSGNHYLEYDVNEDEKKYAFCIHTGSRNLGTKVCGYWMSKAKGISVDKVAMENAVREYVANFTGDKRELPERLKALREKFKTPDTDGFLNGEDLKGYLTDMVIAQAYAQFNHYLIRSKAAEVMYGINKAKVVDEIITTHNYIDFRDMILRKSAIRSYEGERMIIPFNMRDGIAICVGKSNEDWNFSACHGAGRAMSRSKAKKNISMETYKKQMEGIYTTSVCDATIDEAPDAYKPTEEIIELIKDTCDVLYFMKPKINIKAKDGKSRADEVSAGRDSDDTEETL